MGEGEEDGLDFSCGRGIFCEFWETGRSEPVGSSPSSPSCGKGEMEGFRILLAGRVEDGCVGIDWAVSISRRFW